LLQKDAPTTIEDDRRSADTHAEGTLVVTLEGDHGHTVPDEPRVRNIRRP
jgi:hypothetical protein